MIAYSVQVGNHEVGNVGCCVIKCLNDHNVKSEVVMIMMGIPASDYLVFWGGSRDFHRRISAVKINQLPFPHLAFHYSIILFRKYRKIIKRWPLNENGWFDGPQQFLNFSRGKSTMWYPTHLNLWESAHYVCMHISLFQTWSLYAHVPTKGLNCAEHIESENNQGNIIRALFNTPNQSRQHTSIEW